GFFHHSKADLPEVERDGMRIRVIAGKAFGIESPVRVFAETLYCDVAMHAGARLEISREHDERAVLPIEGSVRIAGRELTPNTLFVLKQGTDVVIEAIQPARVMLLGGEALDGPRHMWWNFVSSSKDRIEQAKADWKAGRFAQVPGETEFI